MSYLTYNPATNRYPIRGFSNPNAIRSPDATLVDPYAANIVLWLKGDGTNNSTNIIDSSPTPKIITGFGDAKISTLRTKFGSSSILFETNGYLKSGSSADFSFGLADFTMETFIHINTSPGAGDHGIVGTLIQSNDNSLNIRFNGAGGVSVGSWNNIYINDNTPLALGVWHHLAATRQGNNLRLFLNGVLSASVTNTTNFSATPSVWVGSYQGGSGNVRANFEGVRITKGVARYTANFNPETDTFLDI